MLGHTPKNTGRNNDRKSFKRISKKDWSQRHYSCSDSSGVRHCLYENVPVNFMHLQRNVFVHLFQCLTKNSVKVRDHVLQEERDHRRFLDLWPSKDNGEDNVQPLPGPRELTPEEVRIANNRAMSICLQICFVFKSGSWFTNYQKIHRTSDWLKLVITGILKFCLRGLLCERQ